MGTVSSPGVHKLWTQDLSPSRAGAYADGSLQR